VKSGRAKFSVYFGRILDAIGIDRKCGRKSFHSLRHAALTRWDREGFSLDQCKDYAGHSSAKTTAGYIHR
jgi:integrase